MSPPAVLAVPGDEQLLPQIPRCLRRETIHGCPPAGEPEPCPASPAAASGEEGGVGSTACGAVCVVGLRLLATLRDGDPHPLAAHSPNCLLCVRYLASLSDSFARAPKPRPFCPAHHFRSRQRLVPKFQTRPQPHLFWPTESCHPPLRRSDTFFIEEDKAPPPKKNTVSLALVSLFLPSLFSSFPHSSPALSIVAVSSTGVFFICCPLFSLALLAPLFS